MTGQDSKTCTKCGETKPLDGFYREKRRGKIIHRAQCKDCHKAAVEARRNVDRDAYRAYQRAWEDANRERRAKQNRVWNAANRERKNAQRNARRAADPERYRAVTRKWWATNRNAISRQRRLRYWKQRQRFREDARRYRAANPQRVQRWGAKKKAHPHHRAKVRHYNRSYYERNWTRWEQYRATRHGREVKEYDGWTRKEIYERDGGRCQLCGKQLRYAPGGFQVDHIVPLELDGPNIRANVQLSCQPCNSAKRARLEGQIHLPV